MYDIFNPHPDYGTVLYSDTKEPTHFINAFGKRQRIPEGYIFTLPHGLQPAAKKVKKMNAMGYPAPSNDIVEFDLTDAYSNKSIVVNAAVKAFKASYRDMSEAFDLQRRIRCTTDQFAKFIIYRAESVTVNQIKCLNAKLINVKPAPKFIDVTGN